MKKENKAKPDINKECKWWGIILIIVGIITFFTSGIITGVIVLLLGLTALLFRKDWNLALIGTWFIFLGGLNIILEILAFTSSLTESSFSWFILIGIVQFLIGIYLLTHYYKADGKEISEKRKMNKNIVIFGIVLFLLVVLISTWKAEATISIEQDMLNNIRDELFIYNSTDLYIEGVKSGALSYEFANSELSRIEERVNESDMKIKEALKYSIITYIDYFSVENRYVVSFTELSVTNLRVRLDLTRNELDYAKEKCLDSSGCNNGWCKVEGTDYCCPRPNMKIVNGYCS